MSNKLFSSLVFCISGTLSRGRKQVENEIKKYGGKVASSVTKSVTHLITTENEFENETTKVTAAKENDKIIVKEDFIWDSINLGQVQPATKYSFDNDDEEDNNDDDDDEEDDGEDDLDFQPQPKKRKISNDEIICKLTNFSMLVDDLVYSIFRYLTVDELLLVSRVSKRFNGMITDENDEATVTFLIQTMNNHIRSTRNVSNPYGFFSLLHDEQYSSRQTNLKNDGEEVEEKRKFPINIDEKRLERFSLNFDKFKEILSRRMQSVEKALKTNTNASKEELLSSLRLMESIKFRFTYDQKVVSPWRTAKISNSENFELFSDEDNAEKEKGPTFKGGLKKQLRLLNQNIEKFEEINFSRYTEDAMDTPPTQYCNWITKNSQNLKNIKSVYFLDIDQSDAEVSWICIGDISPIWNSMPNLSFWMSKGSINLALSPHISHHNLRSLTFISTGLSANFLESLFSAYLPKLAHLELFLGTEDQGADFQPELLREKLLNKEENGLFPALEYLGLRNYYKIDNITGDLFESSIAKRVKIIDISLGTLSDKGVLAFINKLEDKLTTDFIGLEVLDMNRCYISSKMRSRLLELPIIVDTEPAEEDDYVVDVDEDDGDDMGDRYIAISE